MSKITEVADTGKEATWEEEYGDVRADGERRRGALGGRGPEYDGQPAARRGESQARRNL